MAGEGIALVSEWTLAVDIGTTSVVAAAGVRGGAGVVEFGAGRILSPAVFCGIGGSLVAGPSVPQLSASAPDRVVPSPKLALAEADAVTVAGAAVPLSQIYAAILEAVSGEAGRDRAPGRPSRLILTHPARWGDRELAMLRAAASAAGLPAPDLVFEPVAAACYLAAGQVMPGQSVAVLDVGGGSTDTAVLRRTDVGFTLAGATGGLARRAGDDLHAALRRAMYELLATITNAGLVPGQVAAVYVAGGAGRAPELAGLMRQILDTKPRLAASPKAATVLGALTRIRE